MARLNHMSNELAEKVDALVGAAVNRIEGGKAAKATVGLAFTVGKDEDGDTTVVYKLKHADEEGGSWQPTPAGQGRMDFGRENGGQPRKSDIDQVAISSGDRSVTMTGEQFDRAAEAIAGGQAPN